MASPSHRQIGPTPPTETDPPALPVNRQSDHPLLCALPALALLGLLALGLTVVALLSLYGIKSVWGIDFFPDAHLRDLLGLERP